jgi:hypothetical protein
MPRPLCQHHHGWRGDLLVQVHRSGDRQARTGWLGVYNPETFAVEDARSRVYGLRGTGTAALAETFRDRKVQQAKKGKTVDEIIEERIEWMKKNVKKPDGEMRPRIETWENVASHLRRFLSPRLGKKIASEVTKHDIATLSNDIVPGKLGVPSVANARHMRRAASGLFNWAAEAGRDYVTASPCVNLPKLDPEHPGKRVLSEDEIRIFWHGLDRDDILGIAGCGSRSNLSWSPCCGLTNCSPRSAASCSISTASFRALTCR